MAVTKDLLCSDPGHAARALEPDWAAKLGTTTGDGDGGLLCGACARLRIVVTPIDEKPLTSVEIKALRALLAK